MVSNKLPILSTSTLCSVSENDNEGFEPNQNDLTVRSKTSILRKTSNYQRGLSIDGDQGSQKRVAFDDGNDASHLCYDNHVELEDGETSEQTINSNTTTNNQFGSEEDDLQPILVPMANRRSFSTGRLRYMKKIDDTLAEKVFMVDSDAAGIFPKFTLDKRTVHRNILNKRKPTLFQQVAKFHHKFGITHYILILVLAVYALLGGLVFLSLESENEMVQLENNIKQLEQLTQNLSKALFQISNVTYDDTMKQSSVFIIRDFYERMLKVEGRYIGSVYHKYEMFDKLTWTYTSAIFYAMTLFSTIGYGSIACQTTMGKAISIGYALIGIPLMLVVLSDIGKLLLRWFTYTYNKARRGIRHMEVSLKRKFSNEKSNLSKIEEGSDNESIKSWDSDLDEKSFPMGITVPLVVLYLLFCSAIISVFDQNTDLNSGISFGNAFYFSFISISTIGLGDVLPNNIEYNPLVALMFLFGLALLSVVNTTVYETLELKLMNGVQAMEDWLESVHYHRHGREGYMVFKSLGPNIQLLALALPLFDDYDEEAIEEILNPENTLLGKRLFPARLSRTRSLIVQNIDNFRPTMGILHIGNQPNRKRATTLSGCLTIDNPSANNKRRVSVQQENPSSSFNNSSGTSPRIRSRSVINPNFVPPPRIRTLSERISNVSSSESSSKGDFKL